MTKREDETGEHSFDELAGGITDGTLSRSRALKAVGAAILGRLRPLRRGRGRMRRITVFLALIVAALASVGAGGAVSAKASLEVDAAAWGRNQQGQLGDRTNSDSNVPLRVRDLKDVTAVAAGGFHSLALKTDGTVAAWGQDVSGQLGNGPPNSNSNVPVQVSNLKGVTAIAGGFSHSLAIKKGGTVAAWGSNSSGQLGNGTSGTGTDSNVPVPVSGLSGVTGVAGGVLHSLAK